MREMRCTAPRWRGEARDTHLLSLNAQKAKRIDGKLFILGKPSMTPEMLPTGKSPYNNVELVSTSIDSVVFGSLLAKYAEVFGGDVANPAGHPLAARRRRRRRAASRFVHTSDRL